MTYSCGIFLDLDGDLAKGEPIPLSQSLGANLSATVTPVKGDENPIFGNEDDPLYQAQLRKIDHTIAKLRIRPGTPTRVLDIGCGWGSLAIRIAERYYPYVEVDAITLSSEQAELAREKVRAASKRLASTTHGRGNEVSKVEDGTANQDSTSLPTLESKIRIHLLDYRSLPSSWEGSFDRVVSIEMMEHVGSEFIEEFWGVVDWALKKGDGVGVVQTTTIPEARKFMLFLFHFFLPERVEIGFEKYVGETEFIRKWVCLSSSFSLSPSTDLLPSPYTPFD